MGLRYYPLAFALRATAFGTKTVESRSRWLRLTRTKSRGEKYQNRAATVRHSPNDENRRYQSETIFFSREDLG
jgi:hypothetical protein